MRGYTLMGLLNDLENQLERQIPAQLQTALQQALDDYRPVGPDGQLAMPRPTATPAPSLTSYGAVRRQVPVFRYAPCRRPRLQIN